MRSELFYTPLLLGIAAAGPVVERQATSACNRDNIFRCILSATGSNYCSSILQYGTKTVYSSTFIPQATVYTPYTVQASTTVTSTITSIATSVQTLLATTTTTVQTPQTLRKRDGAAYMGSRPKDQVPNNQVAKRGATTSPAPACLSSYTNTTSFASRVTSACSCLTSSFGIASATITTVSTAPTATVTQASTVTVVNTISVSPVVSGTTTTTTTLTSVATVTAQPPLCGDNTSLFRVKAGPGSSVSGQYLTPIAAFSGYTDLNSYFTSDVSQAMTFCIDSQSRLLYDSETYNGNGASRVNAAFLNSGFTSEQMYWNTIEIVSGCGGCYFVDYHVDQTNGNALIADNGAVSTNGMCLFTNYGDGNQRPTYFLSTASTTACENVKLVAEYL